MPSKLNQFPRALAIVQRYFPKVKEVADADSPITIEVTDRDSKSAAVRNHESCAMAVACKRKTKSDGVIVSITTAYIIKGDVWLTVQPPGRVVAEPQTDPKVFHWASAALSVKRLMTLVVKLTVEEFIFNVMIAACEA